MASIRSLLTAARVDQAGNSHNCQRNAAHRVVKGQSRLKIRNGRSWDHYCLECAKLIVATDTAKLETLKQAVSGGITPK